MKRNPARRRVERVAVPVRYKDYASVRRRRPERPSYDLATREHARIFARVLSEFAPDRVGHIVFVDAPPHALEAADKMAREEGPRIRPGRIIGAPRDYSLIDAWGRKLGVYEPTRFELMMEKLRQRNRGSK